MGLCCCQMQSNPTISAQKMAGSPIILASLIILLVLSGNGSNVEAKSYGGRKIMQKTRIDSKSILHALMAVYERRVLTDTSRLSPGGPDPQHD
ncbi:hypothetical protein V6N11_073314 [Hibiscus sabdariffa]|uniref:CLAVATA3/ESR (CLE)-related protein n=1 Tax=Hibiscus sabdariffa TaxID=183260 RepID=A0ABR1ZXG5_9ROSI